MLEFLLLPFRLILGIILLPFKIIGFLLKVCVYSVGYYLLFNAIVFLSALVGALYIFCLQTYVDFKNLEEFLDNDLAALVFYGVLFKIVVWDGIRLGINWWKGTSLLTGFFHGVFHHQLPYMLAGIGFIAFFIGSQNPLFIAGVPSCLGILWIIKSHGSKPKRDRFNRSTYIGHASYHDNLSTNQAYPSFTPINIPRDGQDINYWHNRELEMNDPNAARY